jgi:hypothetical protein
MKNAKEKARGLHIRPGFPSRRSGPAYPGTSDDVEPFTRVTPVQAQGVRASLINRSRQLEMANEAVRNP